MTDPTAHDSGSAVRVDPDLQEFEERAIRAALSVVVFVTTVALVGDLYVLLRYGLPLFNATISAEGTFGLTLAALGAALGAGYAYVRDKHGAFKLWPPWYERPKDPAPVVTEIREQSAPPAQIQKTVEASAAASSEGDRAETPKAVRPTTGTRE